MKILMRGNKSDKWKSVESSVFQNEAELQQLIAEEPGILSLSEITGSSHELVFAIREFPISIGSIDVLGLTKNGEIAIIECKLANNPEVKRKVIGQVLEYGASLWNTSYEDFSEVVQSKTGKPLGEHFSSNDDFEWDETVFRENVSKNLAGGNFFLFIVVDQVNEELSKIISFLNSAGQPAYSLAALEVRRFHLENNELLLPHIFGLADKPRSQSKDSRNYDEKSFFEEVEKRVPANIGKVMQDLYGWSRKHADDVRFGAGTKTGTFTFYYIRDGIKGSVFSVFSQGLVCLNFGYMEKILSGEEIGDFREKLATIEGFNEFLLATAKMSFPSFSIEKYLQNSDSLEKFKETVLSIKKQFTLK